MKKKIFLIVIVVLLLTAVAIAFIGSSVSAPAANMGPLQISNPGGGAKLLAGVRAPFTSGKSEIQQAFVAKKAATSFRMRTVLQIQPGRPLETIAEISCPDRERFTTVAGSRTVHAIRIAGKGYVDQGDGTWSVQDVPPTGWSPCGENPGDPAPWAIISEGRDPVSVVAKMLDKAEIARGALVGTPNGNCQQWLVTLKLGGAGEAHGAGGLRYTMCINPSTHFPLAVVVGSGGMVTSYSGWNEPIQIDAPKM